MRRRRNDSWFKHSSTGTTQVVNMGDSICTNISIGHVAIDGLYGGHDKYRCTKTYV